MAPPTRDAAQRAARRASAVFRAVTRGPQPPAPAGWGVEPEKFQGSLAWFRWRELVVFANHFAKHGSVVNGLASDLAAEVGRRLNPSTADEVADSSSVVNEGTKRRRRSGIAQADAVVAFPGSSQEVAAVVYSFSKLAPQLHSYSLVFSAVANGLNCNSWKFSRLEAGLIGTALVDVQQHLSDALPAVVRPVLRDLRGAADETTAWLYADAQAVTIDELRYLVHACTGLPSPGIKVEEVETLAACTQKLIGEANFAKAAHLAVSWLQIRAPAKAKKHYLDALGVACARVGGLRPTHPAHPLLMPGLAPALSTLLAREGQRDPPPITPPLVRDIAGALVQISRGMLSQADTRPPKGDALSFVDLVEISRLVAEFSDDHARDANPDSVRTLPGWAADTLGFTVLRAHRPHAKKSPPDLQSLLTILRLLRRYKAKPTPDESFFVWVSNQLAAHHGTASDSVILAEIVGEIVPQLPAAERGRFARKLFVKTQDAPSQVQASDDGLAPVVEAEAVTPRRLLKAGSTPAAGIALVSEAEVSKAAVMTRSFLRASVALKVPDARLKVGAAQDRLWNRLSSDGAPHPTLQLLADEVSKDKIEAAVNFGPETPETPEVVVPAQSVAMRATTVAEVASDSSKLDSVSQDTKQNAPSRPTVHEYTEAQPVIDELRLRLEAALDRVDALEAKLEQQSSGLRAEVKDLRSRTEATEVKVDAMPKHSTPLTEAAAMPQMPSWPAAFWPEPSVSSSRVENIPARTTLHLRKQPFNFEEFRRAQSQGLQNERIRVLVPPDPMLPTGPRRY